MSYSMKAPPRQHFRTESLRTDVQAISLPASLWGAWPQWRAFAACGLIGLMVILTFTEALIYLP